jgi:hypothetical protein
MNQYFFNVTNEERQNILDKHKEVYDGYVTQYGGSNMTPLTVVDMAKDKGGVTVNSRGEVSEYKNYGINESINEMRFDNKDTGLFSSEAEKSAKSDIKKHLSKPAKRPFHYEEDPSEDWPKHEIDYDTKFDFELDEQEVGPPLDMIADREDDVKHGTVDFEGDILNFDLGDIIPFEDGDFEDEEFSIDLTNNNNDGDDEEFSLELGPEVDVDEVEPIMEQVNKSLDMFKRFKKYN